MVQLTPLEKSREILEDGGRLAGLSRHLLELHNGGRSAQESTRRRGSDLGGTSQIPSSKHGAELVSVQVISTWQIQSTRKRNGQGLVTQSAHHEGNQIGLVQRHVHHLTATGDDQGTPSSAIGGGTEHRVSGHSVTVNGLTGVNIKHKDVAGLGNHVHNVLGLGDGHHHREITGGILRHRDGLRGHAEHATGGILRPTNLHDEELRCAVTLVLLEHQHLSGGVGSVRQTIEGGEHTRVTSQGLRDVLLDGKKLHVANDLAVGLRDTTKQAPLLVIRSLVVDHLRALAKLSIAIKHFCGSIVLNVPVKHR